MSNRYLKLVFLIVVLIVIIFPFLINYFFNDWSKSGTFGDTFGALNALFSGLAFSGLIITIILQKNDLRNQQTELILQRNEMKETREEFLINRLTNLVFLQLERFEKAINELKITHKGIEYIGDNAMIQIDEIIELKIHEKTSEMLKMGSVKKEDLFNDVILASTIFNKNVKEIEKFAHRISNSVEVLESIIYKSKLDVETLNDLKNIFFENVGFTNIKIIKYIVDVNEIETMVLTAKDFFANDIKPHTMEYSIVFIEPVILFYKTRLNSNNFETNKQKWLSTKGENY